MTNIRDASLNSRVRALLVTVAAASAALAVTTVAMRGGVSYINLDALLLEPGKFLTLVVLPTSVPAACVMVSALPVVITVNMSIMVCLLAFLEAGAWLLAPSRAVMHGEPEPVGTPKFYVPDVNLGYVMASSTSARHRRTLINQFIMYYTYSLDSGMEWHERRTSHAQESQWS